jgi:membrane associated rhomboid family serine protease
MPRSGPITMALPPFAGATRKLILINVITFFSFAILGFVAHTPISFFRAHLELIPVLLLRGELWQLLTYSFLPLDILGMVFAMLSLWFTGNYLEDIFGARWLLELYLISAAAGGLLASAITFTHLFNLSPVANTAGAWTPIFALLVAFAVIAGDQEVRLLFILRMKAKYLVAIFILILLAMLVQGNDRFGALTQLCGALMGYLYTRFAPRRGMAFGFSERYFGMRNSYYRWKRRRAARKFEVYMSKQGRKVHFDKEGRYVDPDDLRKNPNDKRWMN